jgi:glycerol-3-phosphate O-acyltransferase
MLWRSLRGNFPGFGATAAAFGPAISLRAFLAAGHADATEALGAELMARVARVVPILPVPLVAAALLAGTADKAALLMEVRRLADSLQADDAVLRLNPQGLAETVDEAVLHLTRRGLIGADLQVRPGKGSLLAFYAASVQQRMESYSASQRT